MAEAVYLSRRESQVMTALSERPKALFTVEDARATVDLHRGPLHHPLQGLVREPILERLARGLYLLIPLEAGPNRIHTSRTPASSPLPSPIAVANWFAEQISEVVSVATTRQAPQRQTEVLGTRLRSIRVAGHKFFGVERTHAWVGCSYYCLLRASPIGNCRPGPLP